LKVYKENENKRQKGDKEIADFHEALKLFPNYYWSFIFHRNHILLLKNVIDLQNVQCLSKCSMFIKMLNVYQSVQCWSKCSMFIKNKIQCLSKCSMFIKTFNVYQNVQCLSKC